MTAVRDAIRKIALDATPDICNAEVTEVYADKCTCDVKVLKSNIEIFDVVLIPIETSAPKTLLVFPKKGTVVTIAFFGKTKEAAVVISVWEADEILLNGDEFGGLVKADELKAQLDKTNAMLEAIISVINAAVPTNEPGNGSPSALQAALKAAIFGKELGNFSNIKNDKVKHG